MNLRDELPGVPEQTPPLFWNTGETHQHNLRRINRWMGYYGEKLPPFTRIDEAAILVPTRYYRNKVTDDLLAEGWQPAGGASDMVHTNPFGTRYMVEYVFLTHPELSWRMEIMMPGQDENDDAGFSPLHSALEAQAEFYNGTDARRLFAMPHLSFKPAIDSDTTLQRSYSLAVQHLQNQGCIHAQTCQSTYGVFGYYLGNDAASTVYLKPRVNMRDDELLQELMRTGADGSVDSSGLGTVRHAHGQLRMHEHTASEYLAHQRPIEGERMGAMLRAEPVAE